MEGRPEEAQIPVLGNGSTTQHTCQDILSAKALRYPAQILRQSLSAFESWLRGSSSSIAQTGVAGVTAWCHPSFPLASPLSVTCHGHLYRRPLFHTKCFQAVIFSYRVLTPLKLLVTSPEVEGDDGDGGSRAVFRISENLIQLRTLSPASWLKQTCFLMRSHAQASMCASGHKRGVWASAFPKE